ncbi:MAG TPA: fused MFS/spermidine synthase [Mycobacteriales bacterium]|nr:fused MFS/spermidine synthase [Mycobacteriales bacterium]
MPGPDRRTAGARPGRYQVRSGRAELLRDADRPSGWLLSVDGVPQSYVDTADPTYLEFDYVRWLADVLDRLAGPGVRLDVVHVGGAGLTLPRYLAAGRPGSRQVVFEPDADLTALVRGALPLGRASGIRVRAEDGRGGIAGLAPGRADAVVVDAFAGGRVPASLTGTGFLAEVARVLRPGGTYLANIADGAPLRYARRVAATVLEAFGGGLLVAEPAVLRGRRFGNLVLAGSGAALPVADLVRHTAAAPFPARVLAGSGLHRFVAGAAPFTDADAVASPEAPTGIWGPR